MIRPFTGAPRSARTCPFTAMGSSNTASKASPVRALLLESLDRRRTVTGVPAGMWAPGGITALVGEIPVACPVWANGRCSSSPRGPEEAATGTAAWRLHPTTSRSPSTIAGHPTLHPLMRLILVPRLTANKSQERCQPFVVVAKALREFFGVFSCISCTSPEQDCPTLSEQRFDFQSKTRRGVAPFGRESRAKAEDYFFFAGFFVTFFGAGGALAASLPPISVNESVALNG